ncbi:hypothetical protein C8A01DRAFT_16219 [Parachaetomium inaequale]|uniref:Uncharacterized protein n=1 Tax=Parachaetomium inaequale TaxID=2588326 RepID=A0AAN6PF47_9PEZI|nr:hypothetical protein C8A01DRAFT_16219 [Parachaetomium inaequale]
MDFRGYSLPVYSGYSAYPRVRSPGIGIEPDRRGYHDNEREFSLCDLSLSDDDQRTAEDMPHWTRPLRRQGPRGGSSRGVENKHHNLKKTPLATARDLSPGIDVALRNLNHEVGASLKMLQALVHCFEVDVEPLRGWAEEYTLDTVWRNKVKEKFREKRDRGRFEGVAARISGNRTTVKGAIKNAKALKEAWEDRHTIERQIRTAKKAIVFCDGIIELAERTATERLACKQLIVELEEARCLLDRKKHPWICKSTAPASSSYDIRSAAR